MTVRISLCIRTIKLEHSRLGKVLVFDSILDLDISTHTTLPRRRSLLVQRLPQLILMTFSYSCYARELRFRVLRYHLTFGSVEGVTLRSCDAFAGNTLVHFPLLTPIALQFTRLSR